MRKGRNKIPINASHLRFEFRIQQWQKHLNGTKTPDHDFYKEKENPKATKTKDKAYHLWFPFTWRPCSRHFPHKIQLWEREREREEEGGGGEEIKKAQTQRCWWRWRMNKKSMINLYTVIISPKKGKRSRLLHIYLYITKSNNTILNVWHIRYKNTSSWSWSTWARSNTSIESQHPWLQPCHHNRDMIQGLVSYPVPSAPHHIHTRTTFFSCEFLIWWWFSWIWILPHSIDSSCS